jgi:hypothetical protein
MAAVALEMDVKKCWFAQELNFIPVEWYSGSTGKNFYGPA